MTIPTRQHDTVTQATTSDDVRAPVTPPSAWELSLPRARTTSYCIQRRTCTCRSINTGGDSLHQQHHTTLTCRPRQRRGETATSERDQTLITMDNSLVTMKRTTQCHNKRRPHQQIASDNTFYDRRRRSLCSTRTRTHAYRDVEWERGRKLVSLFACKLTPLSTIS